MINKRQSNIELCRIASIVLVLLVHTTFLSLGNTVSFGVLLLAGFSIIGVNVFVLITGYFSAKPKKTSLINLAFICLFWMIIKFIVSYFFKIQLNYKDYFFISGSNWFIPTYIVLLFLTPILNAFCNTVNKRQLRGGVIALIVLEIWLDWCPPKVEIGLGGYTVFHFIVLYLLARTIRLHGLPDWFKKLSPIIYIVSSTLLAVVALAKTKGFPMPVNLYAYNNPIVILSSVAFLAMFEQIKLGYSKIVNHLAKSTLAVLLGHLSIITLYTAQFKYLYVNYKGFILIAFWTIAIVSVFIGIILIDQIRIWLYIPINKYITKHITNNDLIT